MNNVAILGTRGRVAKEFIKRGFLSVDCDITNKEQLKDIFKNLSRQTNIDTVINCTGYTKVDKAETEVVKCNAVNVVGVANLVETWPKKIIHLSTDYIFDGKSGPYTETAEPNPKGIYGFSKYFGEVILKNEKYKDRVLIIRTTNLYDNQPDNFVSNIIYKLKNNETVELPDNLIGNPTYIPHLVNGIEDAINLTGVLNIVGTTLVSRYSWAKLIALNYNYNMQLIQKQKKYKSDIRPLSAGLNTTLAESLGIRLYTLTQGLMEYKSENTI